MIRGMTVCWDHYLPPFRTAMAHSSACSTNVIFKRASAIGQIVDWPPHRRFCCSTFSVLASSR
ncbi:hypothetical protein D9613_012002 [Agrocybe pediades]|uniref:Uncharacterized protein n=1 Tax=Agrocybe pediades TaxID=84607 RepID=A0A8H4QF48_9AGAR|nr:hypothetical protein D9613_012002 [Agrocybe pediades]